MAKEWAATACGRKGEISFMLTAALMVCASNSSTPSSPSRKRNFTSVVASQGRRDSKYARPEKYCQYGFSLQLCTTDSSLWLKACLR